MGFVPDIITTIGNVCVLISIPFHVLLFRALWQLKGTLNSSFHVLVRHISMLSFIASVIRFFVEFPATNSPLDVIIHENSIIANIVGYIIDIGAVSLAMAIKALHALTALNRLAAVLYSERSKVAMRAKIASWLCLGITAFFLALRAPCLWPLRMESYYTNVTSDGKGKYFYPVLFKPIIKYYALLAVVNGLICGALIYASYITIAVKVHALMVNNINLQKSVRTTTLAAAVAAAGTAVSIPLLAGQQVTWYGFGQDIIPIDWYQAIFGFGGSFTLCVHPWCLMIIFPEIRKQMFNFGKNMSTGTSVRDMSRSA